MKPNQVSPLSAPAAVALDSMSIGRRDGDVLISVHIIGSIRNPMTTTHRSTSLSLETFSASAEATRKDKSPCNFATKWWRMINIRNIHLGHW